MQGNVRELLPVPDPTPPTDFGRSRLPRLLIALTGIAVGAYLIVDYGWKDVLRALQAVSWAGLAGITLFHALPTLLCGLAWWVLLRPHSNDNWFLYFWLRWIRGSADGLIPILPLSGEFVATRILGLRRTPFAGAGVIVDLTSELIGQLLFAILGFALLIASHPASVSDALILESLVSAARGVIFFVPLNAGVQEGAYLLIGSLLGLPADLALALSLLKRARDLLKGVPALLFWQLIEGKELSRPAGRLLRERSL